MNSLKNSSEWWIIASGPSLTKEDVDKLEDKNVIVINNNYQLAPWAQILYACDLKWWDWHEGAKDFKGEKWTQDEKAAEKYGLRYIKSIPNAGISEDPQVIHQGSNSGIQAIGLAYHFGARTIYLLGYDLQATRGKSHWHGDHPDGVVSCWHRWLVFYEQVAKDAEKLGISIINCTRETALKCFERKELDEVLT